jgi:hypothetical protein
LNPEYYARHSQPEVVPVRRTKLLISLLSLATLALLCLSGCAALKPSGRSPSFSRITLSIKAVAHEGEGEENQWLKICEVLNLYGAVDCTNYERTNCQQVGSIRVCDFDNITLTFAPPLSLKRLLRLNADLLALENDGVSLGLTAGEFTGTYSNLTSQGTLSVRVKISVTPGAALYLERRFSGVCEKVPMPGNVYIGEISLRPGQEWIYYRTELGGSGGTKRFFRLNVSSRREEELTSDEFHALIGRQ